MLGEHKSVNPQSDDQERKDPKSEDLQLELIFRCLRGNNGTHGVIRSEELRRLLLAAADTCKLSAKAVTDVVNELVSPSDIVF